MVEENMVGRKSYINRKSQKTGADYQFGIEIRGREHCQLNLGSNQLLEGSRGPRLMLLQSPTRSIRLGVLLPDLEGQNSEEASLESRGDRHDRQIIGTVPCASLYLQVV